MSFIKSAEETKPVSVQIRTDEKLSDNRKEENSIRPAQLIINPILQASSIPYNVNNVRIGAPPQAPTNHNSQHNLAALLNGANISVTEPAKTVSKAPPPIVSKPIVQPTVMLMSAEQIKNLIAANAIVPPKKSDSIINNNNLETKDDDKREDKLEEEDEDADGNKIKRHQGRLVGKSAAVAPKTNNSSNSKTYDSKTNMTISEYPTNTHLGILNGPNVESPPFRNEAEIQQKSQWQKEEFKPDGDLVDLNRNLLVSLVPGSKSYMKDIDLSGLSEGQQRAIEAVLLGKNILLTGPAGTGKSHCIQKIRDVFQAKRLNVSMTATTGASAILVDGTTIHSWSGIGICASKESALKRVLQYKAPQARIKNTNLLIIDEVSMLSGLLLDIIDYVTRMVRQNDAPFGGLQVLLCGDFYQLSPVKAPTYAFESESFDKLIHEVHDLTFIFRQDNLEFCRALNEIRIGEVSERSKKLFAQCIGRTFEGDIKPTTLYPVREDVNFMNQDELWKLATEQNMIREIDALDEVVEKPAPRKPHTQKFLEESKARLNKDCVAPEKLQLCIGAQVMLIHNLDVEAGLANGTRGIILGFDGNGAPICKFRNNQILYMATHTWWMRINETTRIRRTQYPLILSWALTVHKAQGSSLDCVQMDLGDRVFANGQIYTSISRCRSLEGLSIIRVDWELANADKKVKAFYAKHVKK
jgi:ATP-dependent DNA helicase PIF1